MGARSIEVDGEEFTWKVGRSHVSIRRASDRKGWHPDCHEILGITPDEFERGRWKRTQYGSVTPGAVASWIRANLLEAAPEGMAQDLRNAGEGGASSHADGPAKVHRR